MSPSRITFIAVATSFTAVASLQSLIIPVLSTIGTDLGADAVGQTWMLTAWLISAAVATPLLGRAGDLVGRRRMYLVALGAVALGSVLAAFAPNLTVMLVARVLQGLGAAVFPLGFGLVRDAFPRDRLAGAIGALSAIMAVGSGLGTVIAGPGLRPDRMARPVRAAARARRHGPRRRLPRPRPVGAHRHRTHQRPGRRAPVGLARRTAPAAQLRQPVGLGIAARHRPVRGRGRCSPRRG